MKNTPRFYIEVLKPSASFRTGKVYDDLNIANRDAETLCPAFPGALLRVCEYRGADVSGVPVRQLLNLNGVLA